MYNIKHYFTEKRELEKYFNSEELMNQSSLKIFLGGLEFKNNREPKEKDELYYFENVNFLLGDYLDGYLTQGEDFIFENYFSEAIPAKPSDAVMSIVKFYFDNISPVSLYEEQSEAALISYMRSVEYRNNYGNSKLLETIRKEGAAYFTYLQKAQGKKIISEEEMTTITGLLKKLDKSVYKKQLFEAPWEYLKEERDPECVYQVFFQKVIYFQYKGVDCKALLDIVIVKVHEETREVLGAHVIDLKTTGTPALLFGEAVERFRYDFQISFYRTALAESLGFNEEKIKCSFLVLGKTDLEEPMLRINITDQGLYEGKWGNTVITGQSGLTEDHTLLHHRYSFEEEAVFGFEWALRSYKYYRDKAPEAPGEVISQYGTEFTLTKKGLI